MKQKINSENNSYVKPRLDYIGTVEKLTKGGGSSTSDGWNTRMSVVTS